MLPEPFQALVCGALELGERGEMAVDDAVAGFAEGNGELRGGLGRKTKAREVCLGVEKASYESLL